MVLFQHKILDSLLEALSSGIFSDFELLYKEQRIPCHKAIVSPSSSFLRSLIHKNQDLFEIEQDDDATESDLSVFVQLLYGKSLDINNKNVLPLYLLSKSVSCPSILSHCRTVIQTSNSKGFQIPISDLLSNMKEDEFKDFSITFYDFSLKIHKFLFASISPYFKTKFSRKWQESEDNITDFTGLLKVEPSSFSSFFNSFYNGKLEVNLDNAFDYSHFSWYFQLSELEKFCNNFILESKAEYSWVTSSVLKAINCEDYRFIKIISTKISEIPDLSNCNPIPVHPLFFQHLTANINVSWLLKCLVYSFSNYSEENIWTPESLKKSFETVKFETLSVNQLYELIEPLLSISELFEYISEFSLSLFNKFTSTVPLNWFTWFIVESDLRKEFKLISQVTPLLNEIITPENISQVPITSFNSETLSLFASSSKKEHLVIWMINCLIELWSSSKLVVEKFSTILMAFDLTKTSFDSVYSVLNKLSSDSVVKTIVFEFVSTKLFPHLIQEYKTVKDALEEQNKLLEIPSVQSAIREHEAELKRKEELAQQQAKLNQEFVNKGGAKFLSSQNGSNVNLSNNDLVATRNNSSGFDNAFVAIQHPVCGRIVLTYKCAAQGGSSGSYLSIIGFFGPSYSQTASCYYKIRALCSLGNATQFYNNCSATGPKSSPLSIGHQVIVEFNNNQVTYSIPVFNYSYKEAIPNGHVFGLVMYYPQTSWQISQ
ncbi:hypothetical protein RCL1_000655 [Eukaryota sp. TZLM3-RCL]